MANEEQLSILKQGVEAWNKWRKQNSEIAINLVRASLNTVDLRQANLRAADLTYANLVGANLHKAILNGATLVSANLSGADLSNSQLVGVDLQEAVLNGANLRFTALIGADIRDANLTGCDLTGSTVGSLYAMPISTIFGNIDLSNVIGLEDVHHVAPSNISTDTFARSKGKIPDAFLRGCGLSDWEIENVKLYNPDLSNDEITKIQYKVYELRATQALQISPLFISYSHADSAFVDKVESQLNKKGVRFWRDKHDMTAGRIETQIDQAINQNRTVLLVLSQHSLKSDWVEHEVRTAREIEKAMEHDVLCPVALDDSWKSSRWPKRVMEQIMEYNILDFSAWEDDVKFEGMFRKLIDGLELFYKG
jgi:uncharacterized protein YjbI with pentapeptide repeats